MNSKWWMNGWMDGWMEEWRVNWINGKWMGQWIDWYIGRYSVGICMCMNKWTDLWMNKYIYICVDYMSYQPRFTIGSDHKICSIQFKSVLKEIAFIFIHISYPPPSLSLSLSADMNFLTFLSSIVSWETCKTCIIASLIPG